LADLLSPETRDRLDQVMGVPVISFLGVEVAEADDPAGGLRLSITDRAVNAAGVLHGGVVATLLDLASYLAVLPQLAPAEEAVTHGFAGSYVAAASAGEIVIARGSVLRRTRRLVFTSVQLTSLDRLLAVASVTKSVVARESRSRQ
jgi:uncharacterized protein (TIGR00369 family)